PVHARTARRPIVRPYRTTCRGCDGWFTARPRPLSQPGPSKRSSVEGVQAMATVEGYCDPAFAQVREVFEQQFATGAELGASLAVELGGRAVVDLWGGHRDADLHEPWQRDTLVNVWSVTKGLVALLALMLADRGLLDLDAPVARYWPEFAEAGKADLPVRYLLSHRAGLAGLREPTTVEDLYDWKVITERLAATEPWWEPGSVSGYHALTYGYLV